MDGRYVFLADTGLLRFTDAALLVLVTEADRWREVLVDHETTSAQDWVMRRTDGRPYRMGYGLVTFQVGVDGLALSPDGDWLTFAAMTHDGVFRVPTPLLTDFDTTEAEIAAAVERVGPGPVSDGIETLPDGGIVLTDVENGGLAVLGPDRALRTLVAREDVDWADSVSVAPNGDIWFTDSELTALLGPFGEAASLEEMQAAGPFAIYRIPVQAQ